MVAQPPSVLLRKDRDRDDSAPLRMNELPVAALGQAIARTS
jgi:hypothetical protein